MHRYFDKSLFYSVLLYGLFISNVGYTANEGNRWPDVSPDVVAICKKSLSTVNPTKDLPTAQQIQELKNCDAENLYYGAGQQSDVVKARLCAYSDENYNVLTMIYANGKGVPQNWDLAMKFACQAESAPAETTGRVQHLVKLKSENDQAKKFDMCDDITSGYMMGYCAAIQKAIEDPTRQKKLDAITATWNDADKQKFQKLQAKAMDFFAARIDNEIDLSGTARGALQYGEEASLKNDFLTMIEQFQNGKYLNLSTEKLSVSDKKLNEIYSKIQKNKNFSFGTVTPDGIQSTQKSWLKYRDAWLAFVKEKYPQIKIDDLQSWLTEKRIAMLQEFEDS